MLFKKEFDIFGYSNGDKPQNEGLKMASTIDEVFAKSVVEALALKYPGQWFGYKHGDGVFSVPIRYGIEVAK